ncbi:hemopexin [Actinocorallia herbida]|uniref:Hemopexin n=1 Tax=Actinocorallia herbida TaxID=58109 RepID=A0A3N1D0S8_9ACTN|nr:hemopexin repeat-containing protein [Actinocorallia herbida]ROO87121.1 hemopexin [Actinocorallia herbida]
MLQDESSPAYVQLFGEPDLREDDDARSVTSPAAYLVELLALIEGTFDRPSLLERRPGLKRVLLDGENTYTETPYLDIVNEVLEGLLGDRPYDGLRTRRHPTALPFSLDGTRLRQHLDVLQVAPEELYRLFAVDLDHDLLAREYLRLSAEDAAAVTTAIGPGELATAYGLDPATETLAVLDRAERLAAALGLTGAELRELVAATPPVAVEPGGAALAWHGADKAAWLDRAHRSVKLARLTGLTLTDLGGLLDACCGGRVDLQALAAALHLHRVHGLAITDVRRLVVPVEDDDVQGCSGDILADRNQDYRYRLAGQIDVAESEIAVIVRRYRERYADREASPFDRGDVGPAAIGLLRRAGVLTAALGVTASELFDVMAVLETDPSQRRFTTFPVIGRPPESAPDCFRILEGGDPAESLWLAQTLFALLHWAQATGFAADELGAVLGGRPEPDDGGRAAFAAAMTDAFEQVGLAPSLFAGGRFGERAAQVVHEVLTAYDDGVVSPADDRLLRLDPTVAATAAYDAVTDLGVVVPEDFAGLGLGDRLRERAYAGLVRQGVLTPDGVIAAAPGAGLVLATDFGAYRETLFKLIGAAADGSASVHPSDLAPLGLPADLQAELYGDLVFHGHLDEDGELLDPGFFLDPRNAPLFSVSVGLADAADAIAALIDARIAAFTAAELHLDQGIFAGLQLPGQRLAPLVDALVAAGHLDAGGRYRDPAALAAATPRDFPLALEFHPHRRAILAAMQSQIAGFQAELLTVRPDDLAEVADAVACLRVIAALDGVHTSGGRVLDEDLFADPAGSLDLGPAFTEADRQTVFARIGRILADERPYRVSPAAFSDLGLTREERDTVLGVLIDSGRLTEGLAVAEEWLEYFAAVGSVYDFTFTGLEDYSHDLFFLLHAVAVETSAAVAEITGLLAKQAERQSQALYGVLSDASGVPADAAAAICGAVTGGRPMDVLAAPALTGALLDPRFRLALRRIRRFALLAAKLGLTPVEITAVFRDQDLVAKFPEGLALPPGVSRFDALLEGWDGRILVFAGTGYWTYAADTYALADPAPKPLTDLSARFAGLTGIDAAFTLPTGVEWLVGRTADGLSSAFTRERGGTRWAPREQTWGRIKNAFTDPARVDGAFTDSDGYTYLFAGDQYVRYSTSDYTHVDEGYPRPVAEWAEREGVGTLPTGPVDAFQTPDGRIHVLDGTGGWGRIRSSFDAAERLDTAYTSPSAVHLVVGGQTVRYSDSIENPGVRVDEGFPRKTTGFPPGFESGVEAAFTGPDGVLHLFKDGATTSVPGDAAPVPTADRWGVLPDVLADGTVGSLLAGADGRTYLFSGRTYLRYSDGPSVVDAGYPRSIARDWAGLDRVDASFVLDGQTYLFGSGGLLFELEDSLHDDIVRGELVPALRDRFAAHGLTLTTLAGSAPEWTLATAEGVTLTVRSEGLRMKVRADGSRFHVRYSTPDYGTPDAGFPRPLSDNWWNMPAGLHLGPVDAVFTGLDDRTYLFAGDRFVTFDARHRWWSAPKSLREHWDSVPFDRVDAAFVDHDGRTYVFSGTRFVRYSTADYTRVDDGYPRTIAGHWDDVRNNIRLTGRVDAALVRDVTEKVDGVDVPRAHTYLFSGDQYFRYAGGDLATVEDGYPRLVSDLASEPGFGALDVVLDGVDAAYADRRTAYLFRGGLCHAVSASTYRKYDDLGLGQVTCAFVEDGGVVMNGAYYEGWTRRSALEGGRVESRRFRPRTLRTVPERFRQGLDAVLMGADGNTYLFQGAQCFNTQLNRAYPLADEWGRPRNTVHQESRIDAAFTGRDGRTYLFCDDQFIVSADAGATAEGDPRTIAEHWAGLPDVSLAYVHDGVTSVFSFPDDDGRILYSVYSGADYSVPDDGYPAITDTSHFGAPDGFPFPDAVLFEGATMILLSGEDCVSYRPDTGHWSIRRPIERLWPGFARDLDAPDGLRTAFTVPDGATYFFYDETYTRWADGVFGPQEPIRDRWGVSKNPFLAPGGTVDAAFVWQDTYTYLFSGDRYVRYTGPGYAAVDPGYPKKTAVGLRQEPPFTNLPETFVDALDQPIQAVIGNDRTIHLIVGGVCHTVSPSATATYGIEGLGQARNTIADTGRVDAAIVSGRRVYLLSGDQYVRYSTADRAYVDDGYPRSLDDLSAELGVPALPEAFRDGVDAAFRAQDGTVYLFKGKDFVGGSGVLPIAGRWGTVGNAFADGPLQAAFVSPAGELHAFSGGQYVRYGPGSTLEYADAGFPRTVDDDWGDLPPAFEAGPDGAFTFAGRAYLTSGDRYVRFSGDPHEPDRYFPQEFRHRWSATSDYRLGDLHTIVRFVYLARSRTAGLAEFLVTGAEDPYAYLAELLGWDPAELRWARRNSGLLTPRTREEASFEIEFLLRLDEVFAAARTFGTGPSEIHETVWARLYGPSPDPGAAADALAALIERRSSPAEWTATAARLRSDLNARKRDALVAAVTAAHGGPRELFERYLLDVSMGPEGTTSRVREAIAAAQLFLHRYLLDLEPALPRDGEDPDAVRDRIRTWWEWLKNHRIWEANRKVFLYPENYLRPELRAGKTPAFQALEEDLLRGETTQEGVRAAYQRYLDEYTEVSRLAIAGGYVYPEDGAPDGHRRLVLFGRTRTEPRRYYHRAAEFRDGAGLSSTWEPWQKVDVQIDAERVDPVHAFGRVFVFWPVVEAVPEDDLAKTTIVTTPQAAGQKVTAPPPRYRVRILYSFRNLNGEWVPAQVLAADRLRNGPITGVSLYVQASRTVPGVSDHDAIVVQCSYAVGGTAVTSAFTLTPELYGMPAAGTTPPARAADLSRIFDEPGATPIDPAQVVRFNAPADTTDGPWSSVDHKGGSFLCRPVAGPVDAPPVLPLKGNEDRLPTTWERVDAAFRLPDGTAYFFDNAGGRYVAVPPGKLASQQVRRPTGERFGLVATALGRTGTVDAVLVRGDHVFLFSGEEYYRHPRSGFGRLDPGYPKRIEDNTEDLPRWPKVDAAFSLPSGIEIFHSRARDGFAVSGALGTIHPITAWGVSGRTGLDAVVVRGGRTHLVFGDRYVRLMPDNTPERGYPKPLTRNPDGVPETGHAGPSFTLGTTVYAFDNAQGTYTVETAGATEPPRSSRGLGRVPTALSRTGAVEAAYVADGKLFLIGSGEYVRYTLDGGAIPDHVDAGYPRKPGQPVDAVFQRDGVRYVFSGGRYGRLQDGQEPDAVLDLQPIGENWRCLPAGFPQALDGVLDGETTLYFFLGANYAAYPRTEDVPRPYEIATLPTEIIRLTSSTAAELNRRLLTGGVGALLDPSTQELDELPRFSAAESDATTVRVRPEVAAAGVPVGSHLDFDSANGVYYWEIFFHAPLLIAQALNSAQRFDEARRWYSHVFDPTERGRHWRFLPFLAADVPALVAGCRDDLRELGSRTAEARLTPVLDAVAALAPAFLQARDLTAAEDAYLAGLADRGLDQVRAALDALPAAETGRRLRERVEIIGGLRRRYRLMGDRDALLRTYLDDPFDPHAIAALRPSSYRRSTVMAYIDNLLDWGDLLFRQYTAESIDEARMLYVFAYDLLGDLPFDRGPRALSAASTYDALDGDGSAPVGHLTAQGALLEGSGAIHAGVANPYFHVPGNAALLDYRTRVEDRLRKIRASLDILGVSRPVPLFEPPADVMALVRGVARGASVEQVAESAQAPVPAYKFPFLHRRATDLADRLRQLAGDLLGVFERRDAEELALLHNRQEAAILALTRDVRAHQVEIARAGLREAEAAFAGAAGRVAHYEKIIADGLSPLQQAQIATMSLGVASHFASGGLKVGAAIAAGVPQSLIGPFIMGVSVGGDQVGDALHIGSEVAESFGEAFGLLGELLGVRADQERQLEEWRLQLAVSRADVEQLGHQVRGAEHQVAVALRELEINEREAAHTGEVGAFLTGKFTGAQLYGWMAGRLSGLYFQTYHLAYEMAVEAERAHRFEHGATGPAHIQPTYWDGRRAGLLAAEALSLDLERLGQAHFSGDARGLEITKRVSLFRLDPLALLALLDEGRCEFALDESLFDRDFPGHYRRRIRTLSVTFETADGPVGVNATLTQLDAKTVLEPDAKAVRYLLDPKGSPPETLRGDWRPSRQIALSDLEEGRDNNGLFELRYDDDRYVPFEGTGAVSRWRLEAPQAPYGLLDVTVTVKYTAEQGGESFATAVKGMLKPYPSAAYVDVATAFPEAWNAFLSGDSAELLLPITEDLLPGIVGRRITGVCARYSYAYQGEARFLVGGDRRLPLDDGRLLGTPGGAAGTWRLVVEGDRTVLAGLGLILTYRAGAR